MAKIMTNNNVIVLESILNEYKKTAPIDLDESELFELFSNEQILKSYHLSTEELLDGIIDGGNDGGIDSIFVLLNDKLCTDEFLEDFDSNISPYKVRDTKISLFIIQTKTSAHFQETPVKNLITTSSDFFDLEKTLNPSVYKEELINKRELFKEIFCELAAFHPIVEVKYFYCTKGSKEERNEKIDHCIAQLKKIVKDSNIIQSFCFELCGAQQLIDFYRIAPLYKIPLKFEASLDMPDSYILLVKIKDYYDFITDKDNDESIRDYLFESNIRDHQGNVSVNKDIKNTLINDTDPSVNFWWLNNGVTIIASAATIAGKTINLDKIQIVNGLQTSYSIFQAYYAMNEVNKNKTIHIKIIMVDDDTKIEKIIKATNSQTPLATSSMRAADPIQKDIEDYLKTKNLFYDRRKNHYKNAGKPSENIINIQYLAQIINALLLKNPNVSRATPGKLVSEDSHYHKIFCQTNIEIYGKCILFMKKIVSLIGSFADKEYLRHEKMNFKYHIALMCLIDLIGNDIDIEHILRLDLKKVDDELVYKNIKFIIDKARIKANELDTTILSVAKNKEFAETLINNYITR